MVVYNGTTAFQQLANGSYINATNTLYTHQTMLGEWWILIVVVATLMLAYIGTKDEGILAAIGIIGSMGLISKIPPAYHPILYIILAFSLALLLYRVFKTKD